MYTVSLIYLERGLYSENKLLSLSDCRGGLQLTLPTSGGAVTADTAVQVVSNLPAPSNGDPIYRFLGMLVMRTRWMAGAAAHKSG